MKPEELQLGDIVTTTPSGMPIKVVAIHRKKVAYHACTDRFSWVRIGLLRPIPLTPEILEKNGFELKGSGWLWCEDKDVETQNYSFVQFRRNKEVRIVEINFLNKAVTKFRNVQNVHELQHALRLCGIDKEIEI